MTIGPEFSPTLRKFCVLLRCQAFHTANGTQPNFAKREEVNGVDASRMRWSRIVNVNETIEIGSLVSRGPQKHFKIAMASRRAAFSGNASLIATFSSSFICLFAIKSSSCCHWVFEYRNIKPNAYAYLIVQSLIQTLILHKRLLQYSSQRLDRRIHKIHKYTIHKIRTWSKLNKIIHK